MTKTPSMLPSFGPLAVLAALLITSGCASPSKVYRLRGKGSTKVLAADPETVLAAARKAAEASGLSLVDENTEENCLVFFSQTTGSSWGEYVGVCVEAQEQGTLVEIISTNRGPYLLFTPKDYTDQMWTNLETQLKLMRLDKLTPP